MHPSNKYIHHIQLGQERKQNKRLCANSCQPNAEIALELALLCSFFTLLDQKKGKEPIREGRAPRTQRRRINTVRCHM